MPNIVIIPFIPNRNAASDILNTARFRVFKERGNSCDNLHFGLWFEDTFLSKALDALTWRLSVIVKVERVAIVPTHKPFVKEVLLTRGIENEIKVYQVGSLTTDGEVWDIYFLEEMGDLQVQGNEDMKSKDFYNVEFWEKRKEKLSAREAEALGIALQSLTDGSCPL